MIVSLLLNLVALLALAGLVTLLVKTLKEFLFPPKD